MKLLVFVTLCGTLCSARVIDTSYTDILPPKEAQVEELYSDISQRLSEHSGANNEYWLFTRKNPLIPQIINHYDTNTVLNSNYDGDKPIKVLVHGWTNNGTHRLNTMVTAAYLETYDVNVIVLDWRQAASGFYLSASAHVPSAGEYLGYFLEWLIQTAGGNWDQVHLIGFSLGAHLVGNTGRTVNGRPQRVTGLDPAGPFWSNNKYALDTHAGKYVEAIHTNVLAMGITEPIAHVDFYPNGGHMQPGCDDNRCAHARAYELFASSVMSEHLVGRQCSNLLLALISECSGETLTLGNGNLIKRGNGLYALKTQESWPY